MNTITIIGSGGMASAIGSRTANAGFAVEVHSRDPDKARIFAEKLAGETTVGAYGKAPAGDIVILAVPYAHAGTVVAEYGDALAGKVIIDITNPISADGAHLVIPHGNSGAQEIAKVAPADAHIVKAFNTLFGHVLSRGGRLDAFFAADDVHVKTRIAAYLASIGLRPLDIGGLHMAQTLEALGLLLIGVARNGAGTFDIALNIDIGLQK
jgi:predicted dinucleotide-binding enzyme